MQLSYHVKKGDNVVVISGKEKGKTGEIFRVDRKNDRVYIKGLNMIKRHRKPSAANIGGVEEKEAPIHISNVMHVDPKSGKPTRVGMKLVDGKKVRFAKKSGEVIDKK